MAMAWPVCVSSSGVCGSCSLMHRLTYFIPLDLLLPLCLPQNSPLTKVSPLSPDNTSPLSHMLSSLLSHLVYPLTLAGWGKERKERKERRLEQTLCLPRVNDRQYYNLALGAWWGLGWLGGTQFEELRQNWTTWPWKHAWCVACSGGQWSWPAGSWHACCEWRQWKQQAFPCLASCSCLACLPPFSRPVRRRHQPPHHNLILLLPHPFSFITIIIHLTPSSTVSRRDCL